MRPAQRNHTQCSTTAKLPVGYGRLMAAVVFTACIALTQLAAGAYHTCGITTTGEAYCWGLATGNPDINAFALGNAAYSGARGTQRGSRVPVPVTGELTFREITASNGVSCGLTVTSEALCWGDNNYGILEWAASILTLPLCRCQSECQPHCMRPRLTPTIMRAR